MRKRESHGMCKTSEYDVWRGMKKRCYLKTNHNYHLYGGRGISICDEWLRSFMAFFKDMGVRPQGGYSLERIDNSKGYSKDNCKWATDKEQANNTRKNRVLEHKNVKLNQSQWSEKLGIKQTCISERMRRGYSIEKALTSPLFGNVKKIKYMGQEKSLNSWCIHLGLAYSTIRARLKKGISIKEAFEMKSQQGKKL